jgi:uncharacterized protein (TIGR00251 family)
MILSVKVVPRASRSEVVGRLEDGTLKVRVASIPDKGKANLELCEILAAHFGVARSKVAIVAGQTSTRKQVRIDTT